MLLSLVGTKDKALIIFESNVLIALGILNSLEAFLVEQKSTLDFEGHLKASSPHEDYKVLSVCTANDCDILSLNLLKPPNQIDSLQFLEVLKFNLKIIGDLQVGDIIKFNKNGLIYQTAIFIGKLDESYSSLAPKRAGPKP